MAIATDSGTVNRRNILRWDGDHAVVFASPVNPHGVTELTDTDSGDHYQIDGAVFNALITTQTAQRVNDGHAEPAVIIIPPSLLTLAS